MSSPLVLLLAVLGIQLAVSSVGGAAPDNQNIAVARRPRGIAKYAILSLVVGVFAVALQGCDNEGGISKHVVGNWRSVPSYLSKFKFVPPGQSVNRAVLNSCSQKDAPASWQCSGRGYCRFFYTKNLQLPGPDPIAFCQCDRDYADPECGTERKSQKTAFFYSIFLGYVGADYFYLGFPLWGLAKLCTWAAWAFGGWSTSFALHLGLSTHTTSGQRLIFLIGWLFSSWCSSPYLLVFSSQLRATCRTERKNDRILRCSTRLRRRHIGKAHRKLLSLWKAHGTGHHTSPDTGLSCLLLSKGNMLHMASFPPFPKKQMREVPGM